MHEILRRTDGTRIFRSSLVLDFLRVSDWSFIVSGLISSHPAHMCLYIRLVCPL